MLTTVRSVSVAIRLAGKFARQRSDASHGHAVDHRHSERAVRRVIGVLCDGPGGLRRHFSVIGIGGPKSRSRRSTSLPLAVPGAGLESCLPQGRLAPRLHGTA